MILVGYSDDRRAFKVMNSWGTQWANGPPLYANAKESVYRDLAGLVATGTGARTVGTAREALGATPIVIPYYALNFQPTGYQRHYDLTFIALVYLGNRMLVQSIPIDL